MDGNARIVLLKTGGVEPGVILFFWAAFIIYLSLALRLICSSVARKTRIQPCITRLLKVSLNIIKLQLSKSYEPTTSSVKLRIYYAVLSPKRLGDVESRGI